jgi:hypothetical protein
MKCTAKTNVFEIVTTLPCHAQLSGAAVQPCQLQLCTVLGSSVSSLSEVCTTTVVDVVRVILRSVFILIQSAAITGLRTGNQTRDIPNTNHGC